MKNTNIPRREQLPLSETVVRSVRETAMTAGKILLAGVEGALAGAIMNATTQWKLSRYEQEERTWELREIEQHANNPEAHKSL